MIQLKNVSYSYRSEDSEALSLRDLSLTIPTGSCAVICGASGCGKTTVTRLINGLIPQHFEGELTGTVTINGVDISNQPLVKTAHMVGSVFQNPRSQFFNVDTTSELAFGCENLGLQREEIQQRLAEARDIFALEQLMDRSIFELSGGEKQRIACASVFATHPDIIVLDEPSSNLDATAIEHLRLTIELLKQAGKTVVISEHRLYYLADIADVFFYLEKGSLTATFNREEMRSLSHKRRAEMCLRELDVERMVCSCAATHASPSEGEQEHEVLTLRSMNCSYEGNCALCIDDLSLASGRVTAIIGKNGAGKSTFARCLCGLQKHKGSIYLEGECSKPKQQIQKSFMVMQDVNHQLFTESVLDEIALGVNEDGLSGIDDILCELGLDGHKETHPLALSGGQKQRVAIASALCSGKQILIYDEPTSGLDYHNMLVTCRLIEHAAKDALLSLVITHDLEFILTCCNSVLHIEDGRVVDYYALDEAGVTKVKSFFMLA